MQKYTKLQDPIHMRIYTRKPGKWILIDTETGEVYQGNNLGYWNKLSYNEANVPKTTPPDFPSDLKIDRE